MISLTTVVRDATGDIGSALAGFFHAPPDPPLLLDNVKCPGCGVMQLAKSTRTCCDPACGAIITLSNTTGKVLV